MLIVKGTSVAFDFVDGASLDVKTDHAMMHDPEGRSWPRCSVLIAPYRKGTKEAVPEGESFKRARDYYGRSYVLHQGSVELPASSSLVGWRKAGQIETLYYRRPGYKRPGKYHHTMPGTRRHFIFGKKGYGVVYVQGRFVRVELPRGCRLDDRGFLWP